MPNEYPGSLLLYDGSLAQCDANQNKRELFFIDYPYNALRYKDSDGNYWYYYDTNVINSGIIEHMASGDIHFTMSGVATEEYVDTVVALISGVTDHILLSNIGTTTHPDIDVHIGSGELHIIDHGLLEGLIDDDHVQYIRADGTRNFTGTISGIYPTEDNHLTTKEYVDDNIALASGVTDHTLLSNIGTTTHPDIDVHIGSGELHVVDHGLLDGLTDDDHIQYILVDGSRAFTSPVLGERPLLSGHLANKGYIDDFVIAATSGVTDHGLLTGLDDDDHTQYSLINGFRGYTDTISGVYPTSHEHLATKEYIDNVILSVSGVTDHELLSNIGVETHPDIDAHLANSGIIHYEVGSIDHDNIINVGSESHSSIDAHLRDSGIMHYEQGAINHTAIQNIGVETHANIDAHLANSGVIHYEVGSIDHSSIQNIGNENHTDIDAHLRDSGIIHYEQGSIDHTNIANVGTYSHTDIDSHLVDSGVLHYEVGSIDHGSIAGLTDDDHTNYSLVDGTRPFTGTISGILPTEDNHLATKEYVDSAAIGDKWVYNGATSLQPIGVNDTLLISGSITQNLKNMFVNDDNGGSISLQVHVNNTQGGFTAYGTGTGAPLASKVVLGATRLFIHSDEVLYVNISGVADANRIMEINTDTVDINGYVMLKNGVPVNNISTTYVDTTSSLWTGSAIIGYVAAQTFTSGNWNDAYAHISANGSSHTYINQDVTTTSNPTFGIVNATTGFKINSAATLGHYLRGDGTNFVSAALQLADIPAHNVLSATHGDTLTASVVRGDIIIGNSTPKWSRLAKGTEGYYLKSGASDVSWALLPGGLTGFANPSATIGLTVVNGAATTAMRSDGAPPLSQAIAPTWTNDHIWGTDKKVIFRDSALFINSIADGYMDFTADTAFRFNTGKLGIGVTPTNFVDIEKNDGVAGTVCQIKNNTGGTGAYAGFSIVSNSCLGQLYAFDDGYSDANLANKIMLYAHTDADALIMIANAAAGVIEFYTGGYAAANKRMTITSNDHSTVSSQLLVGITAPYITPSTRSDITVGGNQYGALIAAGSEQASLILYDTGGTSTYEALCIYNQAGYTRFASLDEFDWSVSVDNIITIGNSWGTIGMGVIPVEDYSLRIARSHVNFDTVLMVENYRSSGGKLPVLALQKSHSDTVGTLTTTVVTDILGRIDFNGVNSSNARATGAYIKAVETTETPGAYTMADLYLTTHSSTSTINSNQLVLRGYNGSVGFGVAAPTYFVEMQKDSATAGTICSIKNNTGGAGAYAALIVASNSGDGSLNHVDDGYTVNLEYAGKLLLYTASPALMLNAGAAAGVIEFYTGGSGSTNKRMILTNQGTLDITPTDAASYNEGVRCHASSLDYSTFVLGAVAGTAGTGVGQWSIIRHPAALDYKLEFTYNSTIIQTLTTGGIKADNKNFSSASLALGDDVATSITPGNTTGQIVISCKVSSTGAIIAYKVGASPTCLVIAQPGSVFSVGTGTLTSDAIDGADGYFNVYTHTDGKIYFKNRYGAG